MWAFMPTTNNKYKNKLKNNKKKLKIYRFS